MDSFLLCTDLQLHELGAYNKITGIVLVATGVAKDRASLLGVEGEILGIFGD